jgi:hypothetical protein
MMYYLNLFSPETYEAFSRSDRKISGFRPRQRVPASRIKPGDRFLCYMTKLSRWCGTLEVQRGPFEDSEPIFYTESDPFIVRFEVTTIIWLDKDKAIPIRDDMLWQSLSFTKGCEKNSSSWTGRVRASLAHIDDRDGRIIEAALRSQGSGGRMFDVDEREYRKLLVHRIRRLDKVVSVSVPQTSAEDDKTEINPVLDETRESLKVQALIADVGSKMGFKIWLPRSDRLRVQDLMKCDIACVLNVLPLNYDETTIKTIEQIDILCSKGVPSHVPSK